MEGFFLWIGEAGAGKNGQFTVSVFALDPLFCFGDLQENTCLRRQVAALREIVQKKGCSIVEGRIGEDRKEKEREKKPGKPPSEMT